MKTTVNTKWAEINRLRAEIFCTEKRMEEENFPLLIEEILNLRQGVGEGYRSGDYYAPDRYYSSIAGVKNIRFMHRVDDANTYVHIKCDSMLGVANVPAKGSSFKIDEDTYIIEDVFLSSKSESIINY